MLDYRLHYAVLATHDRVRELRNAKQAERAKAGERIHRLPNVDRTRRRR